MVVNYEVVRDWAVQGGRPPRGIKHVVLNEFGMQSEKVYVKYLVSSFPNVNFYSLDFLPMNKGVNGLISKVMRAASALNGASEGDRMGRWVTTGMVGAAFLLNMCEEV